MDEWVDGKWQKPHNQTKTREKFKWSGFLYMEAGANGHLVTPF